MAANDSKLLPELMAEKDHIDPSFSHALRLLNEEIEKIKNPDKKKEGSEKVLLDGTGRVVKVECDVRVPVEAHPKINFVGRLIGPQGATMKGIQQLSGARLAVLGKGSVREKDEKKLKESGRAAFLDLPLHVHISAVGSLPEAYMKLSNACLQIQKLLQGDEDTELQYAAAEGRLSGRGDRSGMGPPGGRGGGGRGQRGMRGGMHRGGPAGRGVGGVGRGMGASPRGMRGRGSVRGMGRGQQSQFGKMKAAAAAAAEAYTDDYGYDAYGAGAGAATGGGAYDATGYGDYDESYDASYDSAYTAAENAAYGAEGGYGDSYDNYGYGADYDAYGNGAGAAKSSGYGGGVTGQGSFRGKIGGTRGGMRGGGRQKPY